MADSSASAWSSQAVASAEIRKSMSEMARARSDGVGGASAPRLSVEVVADAHALEVEWRALEERALVTPYQRFDYLAAWMRHAADGDGVEPRLGAVRDDKGRLAMLLPFGVRRGSLGRAARYLGGTHVNLNMPLVDAQILRHHTSDSLTAILADYCRAAGVDCVVLVNQPETWLGEPHPLLSLPHRRSSDAIRCISTSITGAGVIDAILSPEGRRRLRRKERRFEEAGATFARASTEAEVDRLLSVFLVQKAKRLGDLGADDPFGLPGVAAFLREAAAAGARTGNGLTLSSLSIDGEPIAIRGVMRHKDHRSFVVQSFDTEHRLSKLSAGEVLLAWVIRTALAEGTTLFDFGLGETPYKAVWSNGLIDMFDVFLPFTALGHVHVAAVESRRAVVRSIKRNPPLYKRLKRARTHMARIGRTWR
jgi:CelD/BcsL family acetyltransferase involved in cellulose biosynthesis